MGKSTSCFKIISCGGDSREKDDIDIPESKRLNDKQGWSFRKRSSRQRVLRNTVITEIPSPGNKESFDTANISFQAPTNGSLLDKDPGLQCASEKPQLQSTENLKESEAVDVIQKESKVDVDLEERSIIIIQTVVRGWLARGELLRLKNVVKLQAAIRGHLVRKHAVETLRCIQAIIKLQALVRARRARLALEQSHSEELDVKRTEDSISYKTLEKEKLRKSSETYVSIEKLLSNSFVRQLLESASTTGPINVSYHHSKSETTWKWLERWTSFSSVDVLEIKEAEFITGEEGEEKEKLCVSEVNAGIDSDVLSKSADSRNCIEESVVHSESEDNLITYDMDSAEFQPCQLTSSRTEDLEQVWLKEDTDASNVKVTLIEANSLPDQSVHLVGDSQLQYNSHTEFQQNKTSTGMFSSEQPEVKEKKTIFGSRRASNPAFIAAQSKFQELTSMESTGRSISSTYQETGTESCIGAMSSASGTALRTEELSTTEDFITNGSRTVRVGGSDCGTELSITSTLDSPDLSEAGAFEYDHETNATEICVQDRISNKCTEIDVGSAPSSLVSNLYQPVLRSPEKSCVISGESINKITVNSTQNEVKPDVNVSDLQTQDAETDNYRLSPSASSRSHATLLESQGTPSSQISVKSNKRKTDASRSNRTRKSLSAGKKSPSNLHRNVDSPNHLEPLPKDEKIEKRRNSFGSARSDHIEEESRESSTNQSLPHFMRATESARAKVQLNNSPKSSPDVQDAEMYIKKKHSLPGANGRQGSPRIQRSTSQAQKSGKGNERKWQR